MDYSYKMLTPEQQAQLRRQRYLELEGEHFRLSLDIRLAESAVIENHNVDAARGQLAILVAQMAALDSWIRRGDEVIKGEAVPTDDNGHEPVAL